MIRTALLCSWLVTGYLHAAAPPRLVLTPSPRPALRLDGEAIPPVAGTTFRYELEASPDLKTWTPAGALDSAGLRLETTGPNRFFRARTLVDDTGSAVDGAEVLGYNRIFKEELDKLGFLSLDAFVARYDPRHDYLEKISWDPTTAKYWPEFSRAPGPVVLPPALPEHPYDFRLNESELAVFQRNGFVVSQRLGGSSFAEVFYRLFTDDLPVFISTDAILHAWHSSYDRMLAEVEETFLLDAYARMMEGMAAQVKPLWDQHGAGRLRASLLDADYFLTVARRLLRPWPLIPSMLGQEARVETALAAVQQEAFRHDFMLFGEARILDFSQFKPRGHYERSEELRRYFQAFMWTARVDFRVLSGASQPQSLRELGTAIVLNELLERSGETARWSQIEQVLQTFVGRADAMTFTQLAPLLRAGGITSLGEVAEEGALTRLQQRIVSGGLGAQAYAGDGFFSPLGAGQARLPRVFTVTGQVFIPDGWATAQVTDDRVRWNMDEPGVRQGRVFRRRSSGLDVAFSVLDNLQAVPLIAARIADPAGELFRDGLPYQHNLAAARATLARQDERAWEQSIYTRWLHALRALSPPTLDARFPEAMRTRAWAMRTLNTQLASWTQLRHDTMLYAKQPYSGTVLCEYPAGFIEPQPEFWRRMRALAESAGRALGGIAASSNTITVTRLSYDVGFPEPWSYQVDVGARRAARVQFCQEFANAMATLERMAWKELSQQPFDAGEIAFIQGTMNSQDHGYGGKTYDGWYPRLFYQDFSQPRVRNWMTGFESNPNESDKNVALIADVYTAPPDQTSGDGGGVLHTAVGGVDLLMIAVDNGPDRMVYAGPTLSHYEFTLPGDKRLSDREWERASRPPRPSWTRGYLVPQ